MPLLQEQTTAEDIRRKLEAAMGKPQVEPSVKPQSKAGEIRAKLDAALPAQQPTPQQQVPELTQQIMQRGREALKEAAAGVKMAPLQEEHYGPPPAPKLKPTRPPVGGDPRYFAERRAPTPQYLKSIETWTKPSEARKTEGTERPFWSHYIPPVPKEQDPMGTVNDKVNWLMEMPPAKRASTMALQKFGNLFGWPEKIAALGLHPLALGDKQSIADMQTAIEHVQAYRNEMDPINLERTFGIGADVTRTVAEFAVPVAVAGKVRGAGRLGKAAIGFGGHEALQAPRPGETVGGRVKSIGRAATTGLGVGYAGKILPETVLRAPVLMGAFAGQAYLETGDPETAIEAAIQIAGFELLGITSRAQRKAVRTFEVNRLRMGEEKAMEKAMAEFLDDVGESARTEEYWARQTRAVRPPAEIPAATEPKPEARPPVKAGSSRERGAAMIIGKEDILELGRLLKKGVRSLEGVITLRGHSAKDTLRMAVRSGKLDKLVEKGDVDETTAITIKKAAYQLEDEVAKIMTGEAGRTQDYWGVRKPYASPKVTGELTKEDTVIPETYVEDFFARTGRFRSVQSRIKSAAQRIKLGVKERFFFLADTPKGPEGAYARELLRTLPEARIYARDRSIIDTTEILSELDPVQYGLFVKKIFIEDLLSDAGRGKTLPRGVTEKALQRAKIFVDRKMETSKVTQDAYEMRSELWREVGWDLYERGHISAETANNRHYVRHFVLDYLDQSQLGQGVSGKFRKPPRPYVKTRYGTLKDISTDYIEVELKALGDIYAHNAVEDVAIKLGKKYATTEEQAKKTPGYTEWYYKRPFGRHQAQTKTGHDIAAYNEILWRDMKIGEELKITDSVAREALAPGPGREKLYIPEWLARQLDNLPLHQPDIVSDNVRKATVQMLKKWYINVNPIRYNLRNFLGDAERVNAAGYTGAFLRLHESYQHLKNKTSPAQHPDAYLEGTKNGAFGTSLWHELGDPAKMKDFERFREVKDYPTLIKVAKALLWQPEQAVEKFGRFVRNWTQLREDLLRHAVYIEALDRIDVSLQTGKPIRHWAGGKQAAQDVQELAKTDKYKAAAKIARETLGDYGRFTPWENNVLRNGAMPFYSWMKINTLFWPRTFAGAIREGEYGKAGTTMALKVPLATMGLGFRMGKWASRVSFAYLTMGAWNYHNEDYRKYEEGIDPWMRLKPHLNFGPLDGKPIGTIWNMSALSDWTEWFGLDDIAPELVRFEKRQISFDELMVNSAKYATRAPINRIYQQILSPVKAGVTAISGAKTFPDVFDPQIIAQPGSKDALFKALIDVAGTDMRRFIDARRGRLSVWDALGYYLTAGSIRFETEEEAIIRLQVALSKVTKEKPTKPEPPPKPPKLGGGQFPRKGKEREAQVIRNRLEALMGEKIK